MPAAMAAIPENEVCMCTLSGYDVPSIKHQNHYYVAISGWLKSFLKHKIFVK